MKTFWRIFILLSLTWCLVAELYFLAVPLCLWYLFKYRGYELIAVAILVDGYYQAFYSIPVLSIATIILVVLFDLMYTGDNEVVS